MEVFLRGACKFEAKLLDIIGMWLSYDETYEVSEIGQVRNKKTGYIKQPSLSKDGYLVVFMKRYGGCKRIARLVAERFLPAPTATGLEVDHIDRNRVNNCASNLRWVTHGENCQNKGDYKNNTSGHKNIHKRSDTGSYRVYIRRYNTIVFRKTYPTLEEAIVARDEFISSFRQIGL